MPEVNRSEVIKLVLRAFRVSDMDKFIKQSADQEAVRAAQLENQFMAARQQDPGVLPAQDHQAHLQAHATAGEAPAVTQYLQQQMQLNPQSKQQFQQLMQAHTQQHKQFLQGRAQGQPMQQSDKTIPSARDGSNVQAQASALQSVVRSNAQRVGQTVNLNTDQN